MSVSLLKIIYFAFFSIQVPQNIGRQYHAVALSFNSPNNDTTNLSATNCFIFPNDHSQHWQQQQQRSHSKNSSHPWNPNLIWIGKRIYGKSRRYGYQRQTFTFGGTHYESTTSGSRFSFVFYLLISWGLFQMHIGTIDNPALRISGYNRCLTL